MHLFLISLNYNIKILLKGRIQKSLGLLDDHSRFLTRINLNEVFDVRTNNNSLPTSGMYSVGTHPWFLVTLELQFSCLKDIKCCT